METKHVPTGATTQTEQPHSDPAYPWDSIHPEAHLLPKPQGKWKQWHIPLAAEQITLQQAYDSQCLLGAGADDIPLIVKLVENPKFDLPFVDIFKGAIGLKEHDLLHALLGRGMLPADEAFVIGFTMGSSNRMGLLEKKLYSFIAKNLYPKFYKMSEEDVVIFKKAAHLGYVSDCQPLNKVDFAPLMHLPLAEVRRRVGIEVDLLQAFYRLEQQRFPYLASSPRLVL